MKCFNCGLVFMATSNDKAICPKCRYDQNTRLYVPRPEYSEDAIQKERERKAREESEERAAAREAFTERKLEKLRDSGSQGYYEYRTVITGNIKDQNDSINLSNTINEFAVEGWKLHSSFGGRSNSENFNVVLVFEKYIKF